MPIPGKTCDDTHGIRVRPGCCPDTVRLESLIKTETKERKEAIAEVEIEIANLKVDGGEIV